MSPAARRVVAVIPARMASSRFPGKPLVPIAGLPMIEHVRRRVELCASVDEVIVATCDRDIAAVVEDAGGRAVMTHDRHDRCTTRVEEAVQDVAGDVVLIVQGDEPLVMPSTIELIARALLDEPEVQCANLLSVLAESDLRDPDVVKAAVDQSGWIMFLSRAEIPFYREKAPCPVFRQTGIMGFTRDLLRIFTSLPETPFERVESVDMLRLLEHGHRIRAVTTMSGTVGVDRPEDVDRVEAILREESEQRTLFERMSLLA